MEILTVFALGESLCHRELCIDSHCLLCQLLVHKVNGIPPCGNILDKAVLWKFQQTLPLYQGTHGHSAVLEMTNDLSGSSC